MLAPLPIDSNATPELECPSCDNQTTIVDRFTLGGSPGPVEHMEIRCPAGHSFTVPTDWFARRSEPALAGARPARTLSVVSDER